jgi:hypothetical protein
VPRKRGGRDCSFDLSRVFRGEHPSNVRTAAERVEFRFEMPLMHRGRSRTTRMRPARRRAPTLMASTSHRPSRAAGPPLPGFARRAFRGRGFPALPQPAGDRERRHPGNAAHDLSSKGRASRRMEHLRVRVSIR